MSSKSSPTKKTPANARKSFSDSVVLALCLQVSRVCPQCAAPLFVGRGKQLIKAYEIAHIYPLNPTPFELDLLKNEELLDQDSNHPNNLIPLCFKCHKIYDTGKTVEKYRELVEIKKNIIKKDAQIEIFERFTIESDIEKVVSSLLTTDTTVEFVDEFNAKEVDQKLNGDILPLTKRKIKNDVTSFYLFIRERFADLERSSPTQAEIIAQQVKTFYLKQKAQGLTQQEIYENTANWISSKCRQGSSEAASAVASFFVQNCELFE